MPRFGERKVTSTETALPPFAGAVPLSIAEQIANPAGLAAELAQLRALIQKHTSPAETVRILITQMMALAMLSLWGRNRPMSRTWVQRWKSTLERGGWEDSTHQGIAFDTNGQLRDGQHRLAAIAETGIAVWCNVSFACKPSAFRTFDVGYKRNAAQSLKMNGVQAASIIAAAVRLKYRTEHNGDMPDDPWVYDAGEQVGGDEVMQLAVTEARKLRADKRGVTLSSAALAYWLIARHSRHRDRLPEFWDHLVNGHELTKDDAIWKLRRKLAPFSSLGRKAQQYLAQTQQAAFIVLAWNAWSSGNNETAAQWPKWKHTHALPRIDVDTDDKE